MQLNFLFLLAGTLIWQSTDAHPASYDQRQTGDLNVQLGFKDIQVVALMDTDLFGDYVDFNYSYDYADFTIKPASKPTTTAGPTSSVEPWHTWPTIPPSSSTTLSSSSSSSLPSSSSFEPDAISSSSSSSTITTPTISSITSNDYLETEKITSSTETNKNSSKINRRDSLSKFDCPSGYSSDAKGRCRKIIRRRLSFLPRLMKLGPKKEGTSKDLRAAS
ncbi:putative protein TPRXL isoform X1 [Cotesia glomerata]|uniref:putative protein TPRXL isoform X1 n=1 Tax=Cotesia glomerata TaxID=32391 RepID=UPI001D0066E0|nr:putative protein TPRXL isoform X1 [Cotesia glomerata]XP_044584157.1 putative protein TPRXL isoform X1 [Cotesia glomerata]